MDYVKRNAANSIFLILILILTLPFSTTSVFAQKEQKKSSELLLQIMDMQKEFVNNKRFQSQAKMLGEYLEAARSAGESEKVKIYTRVLAILAKIKAVTVASPIQPNKSVQSALVEKTEKQNKTTYESGAALLEIFKANSLEKISDLVPVIRTLWKRNLVCIRPQEGENNPWLLRRGYFDAFLLPERAYDLGANPGHGYSAPYIARYSFYYKAKQSGKYGFNIWHTGNVCKLVIGGVEVVKAQRNQLTAQGVIRLEKGFYRIEFWLISDIYSDSFWGNKGNFPYFQVKVLAPGAFDAVSVTKDMLLMKSAKGIER